MRSKPLLLLVAALLVPAALASAVLLQSAQRPQPAKAAPAPPARPVASKPGGRERCKQQCAAQRKGYVYRAEVRPGAAGSPGPQGESCTCI
jgi:hypothetical protein